MQRPLLFPFSVLYDGITWLRNKLYDRGSLSSVRFSVPVISVGNLAVGGTGKTPHIEYLIQLLQSQYQLATLSRGYKRKTKGFLLADTTSDATSIGDEPLQFYRKFPNVLVSVCEDRLVAIPQLLTRHQEIEVILLDDAYQHRRVRPGLSLLLTDYDRPFYSDYLLPAGNLRENRGGYKRADIIIVSKCPEQLSAQEKKEIQRRIKPLAHQHVFFSAVKYAALYDFYTGETLPEALPKDVLLLNGIAHPKPVFEHLKSLGLQVQQLTFPDHHFFSKADLEEIRKKFRLNGEGNKVIITTEKDATRLAMHQEQLKEWGLPIAVLPISIQLLQDEEAFNNLIKSYIIQEMAENES